MKHLRLKILAIIAVITLVLTCGYINYKQPVKANAASATSDLHTITRIDVKTESNPTITVLTHGLGSHSYFWSNRYDFNKGENIAYNEYSLINRLYQKLNGQMALYVAHGEIATSEG